IPTRSQTSTAAAGSALPRPISTTAQCLSSSSTSLAASFCLERQNNCRFATETSYPSHYRWGPYNSQSLRCRVCSYGKPRGWSCPRLPLRPAQPPQESSFLPSRHLDRKSTRLNSSHDQISYAVFCLKKKKGETTDMHRDKLVSGLTLDR